MKNVTNMIFGEMSFIASSVIMFDLVVNNTEEPAKGAGLVAAFFFVASFISLATLVKDGFLNQLKSIKLIQVHVLLFVLAVVSAFFLVSYRIRLLDDFANFIGILISIPAIILYLSSILYIVFSYGSKR